MSADLKFVALTSSDIRAATVINYILKTTSARIHAIYLDTGGGTGSRIRTARKQPRPSSPSLAERVRYHLGLARKLPRSYFFRILERLTGVEETRLLYLTEKLHPSLLGVASGIRLPEPIKIRPVLRSLRDVRRDYGIPVIETNNVNDPEMITALEADRPDVLIGLGTRILSPALLKLPRIGSLNAHSSLLPNYRGGTTEFWQLVHGEAETGVTIHWMAPQVDEGEVVSQASWPIPGRSNHHRLRLMSLFNRLEVWRDVVQHLLDGQVQQIPQGLPKTPTYRHPSLRQQYEFYCLAQWPSTECKKKRKGEDS
jgi:folate-dependent phosphoribosylglycinamide formyltransferase PurN